MLTTPGTMDTNSVYSLKEPQCQCKNSTRWQHRSLTERAAESARLVVLKQIYEGALCFVSV